MAANTGVQPLVTYNGATDPLKVQQLLDLLLDPEYSPNRASAGLPNIGFLDEISPAALVQLRVELTALKAAVT